MRSLVQLGELRSFQRQVVHQPLLPKHETDDALATFEEGFRPLTSFSKLSSATSTLTSISRAVAAEADGITELDKLMAPATATMQQIARIRFKVVEVTNAPC